MWEMNCPASVYFFLIGSSWISQDLRCRASVFPWEWFNYHLNHWFLMVRLFTYLELPLELLDMLVKDLTQILELLLLASFLLKLIFKLG